MYCIVSGQIDQLWNVDMKNEATHIYTRDTRELSSTTIVRNPILIAGTPFDLEVPTRDGTLQTLHLVQGATAVSPEWLVTLAPEQFNVKRGKMVYDPRVGALVIKQNIQAGRLTIEGSSSVVTHNSKQNQKFFQEALSKWIYGQLENEKRKLEASHSKRIPNIPLPRIKMAVNNLASGVIDIENLTSAKRTELFALTKLQSHFGTDFMNQVASSYSNRHQPGRHNAHRGFKPAHKQRRKHQERWD